MAKSRSKKSKQQKRQAATARRNQKRTEQVSQQEEIPIPTGPLSPGDRLNLTIDAMGRKLSTNVFASRAVALVIDFILCGILCIVPLVTTFNIAGGDTMTTLTDLTSVGMGKAAIGGVLAASLLVSYIYYAIIPLKLLPGKTPGKYLIGLEIVMLDGSPATWKALSLRWLFMTFFETLFTFASALLLQYVTLLAGDQVANGYNIAGALVSAVSTWFVWHNAPHRRALHDLVAGTWVYSGANK